MPAEAIAGRQGVVNATPVGMASLPGMPFAPDSAEAAANGWPTSSISRLKPNCLAAARARGGNKVANGVSMVVGQAAEAFRLFTGREPDRERMLARLESEIAAEAQAGRRGMKTSIATVSVGGDLIGKLETIARAGYDAAEIFENDLLSSPHTGARDRGDDAQPRPCLRDAPAVSRL